MPTINLSGGQDDSEALSAAASGVSGVSKEVSRVANNIALSDHVGKFIAGEVASKLRAENLADKLKGKNAIHVSFSWG
jgi:hypothetical protein